MPAEPVNRYRQDLLNGSFFDLIHVKGGSYFFGDTDHQITLADFCIGEYPVTQALWQAVMGDNPSHFKGQNRPVERVSWYDAAAFCNALNTLTGYAPIYFRDENFQEPLDYGMTLPLEWRESIDVFHDPHSAGFRLPSETEWEYAAQGGSKSSAYEYAGSYKLEEVSWYKGNSHGETKPIGLKTSNKLDIYDMSGNVWEWCADQYTKKKLPQNGAAWIGEDKSAHRVLRGGSWSFDALYCHAKGRTYDYPSNRNNDIGFRVVLFPPPVSWPVHLEKPVSKKGKTRWSQSGI